MICRYRAINPYFLVTALYFWLLHNVFEDPQKQLRFRVGLYRWQVRIQGALMPPVNIGRLYELTGVRLSPIPSHMHVGWACHSMDHIHPRTE